MSVAAISLSGMHAAWSSMAASASNIANLSTPGYHREQAATTADPAGGVQVTRTRATTPGDAPEADLVDTLAAKHAFAANLAVFKAADRMTGRLLDIAA